MIICVCHNVSERGIENAVDAGLSSMKELRSELQVGTCCGRCHASAKEALNTCLEKRTCHPAMQVMTFHSSVSPA